MENNGNESLIKTGNAHTLLEELISEVPADQITSQKTKDYYKAFVDPELIERAYTQELIENRPYFKFNDARFFNEQFSDKIIDYKRVFFKVHFEELHYLGISSESVDTDIITHINYRKSAQEGITKIQCDLLEAWLGMKKVFDFVAWLSEQNVLTETHITALHSIGASIASVGPEEKHAIAVMCGTVCEVNKMSKICELPELVNKEEMRMLMFACPVLYGPLEEKLGKIDGISYGGLDRRERCFGGWINPGSRFSLFLSLFNDFVDLNNWVHYLKLRSAEKLREPMPADVILKIKSITDLLNDGEKTRYHSIILTPYHDVRVSELNDPAWQRKIKLMPIDPYAFVTSDKCRYALLVKRWSASGVLPSVPEMVASTVQFLEQAKDGLLDKLTQTRTKGIFLRKKKMVQYLSVGKYSSYQDITPEEASSVIDRMIVSFKNGTLREFLAKA